MCIYVCTYMYKCVYTYVHALGMMHSEELFHSGFRTRLEAKAQQLFQMARLAARRAALSEAYGVRKVFFVAAFCRGLGP